MTTISPRVAAALISGIASRTNVTIAYAKASGIVGVRSIRPYAVEACKNGETIVRAVCVHQEEPRSFRLDRIREASLTGLKITAP